MKASRLTVVLILSSSCNFFDRDLDSSSMEFATLGFTFLLVLVIFLLRRTLYDDESIL